MQKLAPTASDEDRATITLAEISTPASDEHRATRTELHELSHRAVWDTDLGPLLLGVRRIPLGEPHLALPADQEHEINLQKRTEKKLQISNEIQCSARS